MLQRNLPQSDRSRMTLGNIEATPFEHEDGIGTLLNFVRGFLRRQYGVIIFSVVLSLAAGVIYLRITPPTYTARVQILLGNPKAQFIQQQSLLAEPSFDVSPIRDAAPDPQVSGHSGFRDRSAQPRPRPQTPFELAISFVRTPRSGMVRCAAGERTG